MENSNLENEEHSGVNPELSNPVNIPTYIPTPQENLELSYLKDALLQTTVWAKRFNIVFYVAIGIVIIVSLVSIFMHPLAAIGYVIAIIFYLFQIYYLRNFTDKSERGILLNDTTLIIEGIYFLKKYFKFLFIGSIMIIIFVFLIPIVAGLYQ